MLKIVELISSILFVIGSLCFYFNNTVINYAGLILYIISCTLWNIILIKIKRLFSLIWINLFLSANVFFFFMALNLIAISLYIIASLGLTFDNLYFFIKSKDKLTLIYIFGSFLFLIGSIFYIFFVNIGITFFLIGSIFYLYISILRFLI
ncbi:MAG: hypothetical protein QW478_01725 [Candidatus Micrarchaeaceae archaeon]